MQEPNIFHRYFSLELLNSEAEAAICHAEIVANGKPWIILTEIDFKEDAKFEIVPSIDMVGKITTIIFIDEEEKMKFMKTHSKYQMYGHL